MKKIPLSLLLLSLYIGSVSAQSVTPDESDLSKQAGATTRSGVANPAGNAVEFDIQSEKKKATVSWGQTKSTPTQNGVDFKAWNFSFEAPIDEDEGLGDLLNRDGLANSRALSFEWNKFRIEGLQSNVLAASNSYCSNLGLSAPNCNYDKAKAAAESRGIKNFDDQWDNLMYSDDYQLFLYGFKATVGDKDFSYFSSTDLSKSEQSETPWSWNMYIGFQPEPAKSLFIVGYEYEKFWKDATSKTVCDPSPAESGFLDCVTGAIGAPSEQKNELLYAEWRSKFSDYAFSIKVARDLADDVTSLDMPIYLFKSKAGEWAGGIRFGWDDDNKNLDAGVFVGKEFQVSK